MTKEFYLEMEASVAKARLLLDQIEDCQRVITYIDSCDNFLVSKQEILGRENTQNILPSTQVTHLASANNWCVLMRNNSVLPSAIKQLIIESINVKMKDLQHEFDNLKVVHGQKETEEE